MKYTMPLKPKYHVCHVTLVVVLGNCAACALVAYLLVARYYHHHYQQPAAAPPNITPNSPLPTSHVARLPVRSPSPSLARPPRATRATRASHQRTCRCITSTSPAVLVSVLALASVFCGKIRDHDSTQNTHHTKHFKPGVRTTGHSTRVGHPWALPYS